MSDFRSSGPFAKDGSEGCDGDRHGLKLIRGGKQNEPTNYSDLNTDKFLREHFLEGREKPQENPWK